MTCAKPFSLTVNAGIDWSQIIWDTALFFGFNATGSAVGAVAQFDLIGSPTTNPGSGATVTGHLLYTGPAIQCSLHMVYTLTGTSASTNIDAQVFQDSVPILVHTDDAGTGSHSVDSTPTFNIAAGVNSLIEVLFNGNSGSFATGPPPNECHATFTLLSP